jgi:hypothetical protein
MLCAAGSGSVSGSKRFLLSGTRIEADPDPDSDTDSDSDPEYRPSFEAAF